ncbi:hypothetical protein P691DRAFT_322923 [Macrolepiota fuliginosa MF-IS2]|uniref:Uncharacterized protein n=1 Tax=Macrolepiota fuliginosa MF-IS2 TaxID=1400762 RepID=A0A9P6C0L9_9AGAR|nr:hypothetical protein P691DRAFT_322923 [Macrolepiota fuliginosa MF-IS2]
MHSPDLHCAQTSYVISGLAKSHNQTEQEAVDVPHNGIARVVVSPLSFNSASRYYLAAFDLSNASLTTSDPGVLDKYTAGSQAVAQQATPGHALMAISVLLLR